MHLIDWIITILPLIAVLCIGFYTKKYLKSVADFLAGRRLAGRYLLCVARGESVAGAVLFIAMFEVYAQAGFTFTWWKWISIPIGILVAVTGFIAYRFRETRALTLAQFFELRYSKGLRLFAGVIAFVAGILNFGIIPAVEARFFVYFLQLPPTIPLGSANLPTYIPLMIALMAFALYLSSSGGQITVMITDCTEGLVSYFCYLVIIFSLLSIFDWSHIVGVLGNQPAGMSKMDPFDSMKLSDFNLWFVLMSIFFNVYSTMAWQNTSGYNSAALSAHESRMGNILGKWRDLVRNETTVIIAVCAVTFLYHPDFAGRAAVVHEVLDKIPQDQIREQMRVPTALSQILPAGVKGVLCALFLMGVFGGQTTHLHSWGSIFVQDLLVPLRRKPFSPKQHILALRLGMLVVAVFAVVFGSLFRQVDYVVMWWQITTAIFVGGAGSAIIGGLYWNKGTTAGAWTAMLIGILLSGGGILLRQYDSNFPLNGTQIAFYSMLIAALSYIVVSLLTCRQNFDLMRLLHRHTPQQQAACSGEPVKRRGWRTRWAKLAGVDSDFTLTDKIIAGGVLSWSLCLFAIFIIGSAWHLISPWSAVTWSNFWWIMAIVVPVLMSVLTTIWFTIGVTSDMRRFFQQLRQVAINHYDDGTVVDHRNLNDYIDEQKQDANDEIKEP